MKRRWKILIALGIFIVLMTASLTVTMRVQPEREVDAYKKLLRDKGEKLELSEVVPHISSEDNSADAVENAFRMFPSSDDQVPNAMEMVAPGKALAAWQQPDVRGWDFTNSWPEFSAIVSANQPAMEQLRPVLDRRALFFPFPSDNKGFSKLFPDFISMKRSVRQFEMATVLELHNGNSGVAATNILISLAMVRKNAVEGFAISHLVRLATVSIAIAPTWELLQATNVTDAQLAVVQSGWQQLDLLKDAENAFVVERAWNVEDVQKSRASHQRFKETIAPIISMSGSGSSSGSGWSDVFDDFTKGPRLAIGEALWRSSWSYSDELRTLKTSQIIIETLRMMKTNQSQFYKADLDVMSTRLSSLGLTNSSNALYQFLRIPDWAEIFGAKLDNVPRNMLRTETARRIAITAIALKRFHLKHGTWPQTLNELAPEFISSVPIDPFDGKPLKYRPNPDGTFTLYSVGEDGIDDGGNPNSTSAFYWQSHDARDWVWPQPATPAEIQYFYEHLPK